MMTAFTTLLVFGVVGGAFMVLAFAAWVSDLCADDAEQRRIGGGGW